MTVIEFNCYLCSRNMIRNIIFDYGSVLIRTDCRRVYTEVLGSWEKATWFRDNILDEDFMHRLDMGDDYGACIANLQAQHPDYADAIALYDDRYLDCVVGEMPGMRQILMHLRAYGYHLYGLSNYSHKIYDIERRLTIFRNLEGQIISSDIHITKPDPRIFKFLLAKYGLRAEDSLFIDDRKVNVDAARSLGFDAMVFPDVPFTEEQILRGLSNDDSKTPPQAVAAFAKELMRHLERA